MNKFLFYLIVSLLTSTATFAKQKVSYLEEVYSLGSIAGQGLACQADKYHQFELLARAILMSKATDSKMQKEGMEKYNIGKVEAFMTIEDENFANCNEITNNFNKQKIFKSILYSDGKIKLYNGTIITPHKPYDASKLYKEDPYAFEKADKAYKKSLALAQKNSKNAKKIPLKDSNYNKYANQFN